MRTFILALVLVYGGCVEEGPPPPTKANLLGPQYSEAECSAKEAQRTLSVVLQLAPKHYLSRVRSDGGEVIVADLNLTLVAKQDLGEEIPTNRNVRVDYGDFPESAPYYWVVEVSGTNSGVQSFYDACSGEKL